MKFIQRKRTIRVRNLVYYISEWFDKHNRLIERTMDEVKVNKVRIFAPETKAFNENIQKFLNG